MSAIDLTTLASAKAWVGETGTGFDTVIASLITSASQYFLTATGRDIGEIGPTAGSYAETYDGNGQYQMYLRHHPVTAVSAVTIDGQAILASPDGVQPGFVFDDRVVSLVGYQKFGCGPGYANVKISYTAGLGAIPGDVQHAVDAIVGSWLKRKARIDQVSQSLDGQVISWSQKDVPNEAATVIQQYTNRVPW